MNNGKKQKTDSSKELAKKQIAERNQKLKECADKVIALQLEIEASDVLSIQHGKRSLQLVIEAGTILLTAQDLIRYSDAHWKLKGLWRNWVAENVTGISLRTVQNYMKLAFEANRRDEIMNYYRKKGQDTRAVIPLLEEAKSIREAYRVVGIIKRKKGANKNGDGDPRELTVDQFQQKHQDEYDERYKQGFAKIQKTVQDVIKDEKSANWNLSEWEINKGKPVAPNQETRSLITSLLQIVKDHERHFGLAREDEVYLKAGSVVAELLIVLIQTNQNQSVATPETNRVDPVKQQKIEELLRTINPLPLQPIPLEPMEPATPPIQTVQE